MDYQTPQFYRVMQYAAGVDRDVVDMVSGSPDWEPPAGIRQGLAAYAEGDAGAFDYGPSEGLSGLREAVAAERDVAVERVLITNGAGEANHLAIAGGLEAFPGTEVILADPVYPYYAGRANHLGADTRFVAVDDRDRLRPEAVRAAASASTAVIVVNSPNNPTGAVYDRAAMDAFVDVAESNDALLVSDEVYRRFDYQGRFASALAADSPNVLVTDAASKSMAITGFRVGYAILPPTGDGPAGERAGALRENARTRHMLTLVTGSRPAQRAVQAALGSVDPSYYERNRARLVDRIDCFTEVLDDVGATYRRPDGGFYVMARLPDVPGTFDGVYDLTEAAGVAAMPGAAFGEARGDFLRFALCTPRVDVAAERLRAHLG